MSSCSKVECVIHSSKQKSTLLAQNRFLSWKYMFYILLLFFKSNLKFYGAVEVQNIILFFSFQHSKQGSKQFYVVLKGRVHLTCCACTELLGVLQSIFLEAIFKVWAFPFSTFALGSFLYWYKLFHMKIFIF